ncbi:hypothetical protein C8J57DRAFT_1642508 [Mycena rebaudengoi]|nr:hypothetical protein C8J57DRAFT_1642508 [Mycena rebaudengoi]
MFGWRPSQTGASANTTVHGNSTLEVKPPPKILLVSSLYPLAKSKHSMGEYEVWLSQFLQHITTDVYFYAPVELEEMVRRSRGDLPITINTTYASPFDVPPLDGLQGAYTRMHKKDREKFRHSPELYAVWNAKPFFLDEAVKTLAREGKNYDYAFWNDAGSFRGTHKYAGWPDPRRVEDVWQEGSELTGAKAEDLLFYPIEGVPHPSLNEGSFFGGSPQTVSWWRSTFYAYHDYYLNLGIFVGKDQTVFNALFLLFPSRIITVWLKDPEAPAHLSLSYLNEGPLGGCGPEWFYYQFWLASPAERGEMQDIWGSKLTRVSHIEGLLLRQFGVGWKPPASSIHA